jgi:hypothetical protein
MPSGFDLCANLSDDVNPDGLTMNCYFCTVAALKNMDVHNLVALTETMQQATATTLEIKRLFSDAGLVGRPYVMAGFNIKVAGDNETCNALQARTIITTTVSHGQFFGLAYVRCDGSGHMIAGVRKSFFEIELADFQTPPNRPILAWPPEGGHNFQYIVWLNAEIEDLCERMAGLTIQSNHMSDE